MRNKTSPSEYLAFLSIKYEVDADKFFNALIVAGKNRRSTCGNLSIECRDKQKNRIVLLITTGSKVVAQFPIPEEFLLEQNNPIKDAKKANLLGRHSIKKNESPSSFQIKDLRVGMKSVNLKAKVLEIAKPMLVVTRFGNYASVANASVSDETGNIKLCLWNDQIKSIAVGDTIQIANAKISTFRGERQLRVGKNGTLLLLETSLPARQNSA
jgi:replication factor A1